MKKKKLFAVLCLGILCLGVISFYVVSIREKSPNGKQTSIRPDDFPEILIVPKEATEVRYSTPSNTKRVHDTYAVYFYIKQSFPSKDISDFITEHLVNNEWCCLEYQLLNPGIPQSERVFDLDCIPPEHKGELLRWDQDWIKESDGSISVIRTLFSHIDTPKEKVHLDKLLVILSLFGDESWIVPAVMKYKQLHPEEFQEDVNKTQTKNP